MLVVGPRAAEVLPQTGRTRCCGDRRPLRVTSRQGRPARARISGSAHPVATHSRSGSRGSPLEGGAGGTRSSGAPIASDEGAPRRRARPARHHRPQPRGDAAGILAIVTHELRTPLTALNGYLQLLARAGDGPAGPAARTGSVGAPAAARAPRRPRSAGSRHWSRTSTDAARIQSGTTGRRPSRPTDLSAVVRDAVAVAVARPQARRGPPIETAIEPDMTVAGDPARAAAGADQPADERPDLRATRTRSESAFAPKAPTRSSKSRIGGPRHARPPPGRTCSPAPCCDRSRAVERGSVSGSTSPMQSWPRTVGRSTRRRRSGSGRRCSVRLCRSRRTVEGMRPRPRQA